MTASQHTIAGTVLTMPVKIRKATQHNAMFAVDADAAQRLIDYSGLQVYRPLPRRAIVTLILTRFIDGDLGTYYEYSTCVMVKPPGAGAAALQSAFVQHMFVDQAFTLEAGRTIWGFPKVMSDFTIRDGKQFGFDASIDGQLVWYGIQSRASGSVGAHFTGAEVACVLLSRRPDTRKPLRGLVPRRALPDRRCAGAAW